MNKRVRIFTYTTILLFCMVIICCNGNANKKYDNKNVMPFEITFKVQPVRPCEATIYTITEKSITIDFSANKSQGQKDSLGNPKFDCGFTRAYQKGLTQTDSVAEISSMELEDLEAIPDEGCVGGVGYSVTLKKAGKEKTIRYHGCAKKFDKYTKMIAKYIDKQVPKKYEIHL